MLKLLRRITSIAYPALRIINDLKALLSGHILKRIGRRVVGRYGTGKIMRKMFK